MPFSFINLDSETRDFMFNEIEFDIARKNIYFSKRLSKVGIDDYPKLLSEATKTRNEIWLADQLRSGGRLKQTEERKKPKGGVTIAAVPITAPETLAEGEFNRFYIRGLCRRAIETGIQELIVYRAKEVERPRPEFEQKIGMAVDAEKLLADLRENPGVDTALGLPPGPNSGLSVKLP